MEGSKKKLTKATFVTTVVSCHKVPRPLRNLKIKQGFISMRKQPVSGRKSLDSSSSFLSSGTSSLHTTSSNDPPQIKVLPPDEYYGFEKDSDPCLDHDDGLGRSSESYMESPSELPSSCSPANTATLESAAASDKETVTPSTTNQQSLEGDSGHGDFEEELQFSSVSSTSQFDPISESESDSCSYTYSYYTCSNSCCSGSYSDGEEFCFSRTESATEVSDGASENTELQRETDASIAAERESRAVATLAAQTALSKSYRAYFKRVEKLKRTLANWDNFLKDNGISRPDFFCRYKERESLQQIVDEFNEVTKRHREGILGALRHAAVASITSSDGGLSISTGPSITSSSESNSRSNAWRTKRIRKLLSVGSHMTEEDRGGCESQETGNGKKAIISRTQNKAHIVDKLNL